MQISRTVLTPSLYVIVFLSLLSLRYPECSNQWQSGSVVLIYCMAARMEPGKNVSLRDEHLRYTEATNCSFMNGFQPDVVYMCSLLWQLNQWSSVLHQFSQLHCHLIPVVLYAATLCCRKQGYQQEERSQPSSHFSQ